MKTVRLITAVLWTLVIVGLCLTPGYMLNKIEEKPWFSLPNFDKLIHWGIFVIFSVVWLRVGSSRSRYLWVTLAGVALGVATELAQNLSIVGRDGNLYDTLSDATGVLVGLALGRFVEPLFGFVESRIVRAGVVPSATPPAAKTQM